MNKFCLQILIGICGSIFLGAALAGCAKSDNLNAAPPIGGVEYLYATYVVTGYTIDDQSTSKAFLPNQNVILYNQSDDLPLPSSFERFVSTTTDENGAFELSLKSYVGSQKSFLLKIVDDSNTFETNNVFVVFENPTYVGGEGRLYLGETTRNMGAIKMKRKKRE